MGFRLTVGRYSCQTLIKTGFSLQILYNNQIPNSTKIRPVGPRCPIWTAKETEKHNKASGRFSQFCENS